MYFVLKHGCSLKSFHDDFLGSKQTIGYVAYLVQHSFAYVAIHSLGCVLLKAELEYSSISVYCFPNWIQRHLANRSHYKRLSSSVHGFFFNDPISFKVVLISVYYKAKAMCTVPNYAHVFAHHGYIVLRFTMRVI